MQLKMRQVKGLLIGTASLVCVLAFQNCAPANFTSDAGNPVVFTSLTPDGRDPGVDPNLGDDGTTDRSSLVECELIHPNQKVILNGKFLKGSNNSATRVCMSEHACLELINEYASKRDCTLSLGASSTAASQTQCTKIFPGSKGTCHNATVVTDENVMGILSSMEK